MITRTHHDRAYGDRFTYQEREDGSVVEAPLSPQDRERIHAERAQALRALSQWRQRAFTHEQQPEQLRLFEVDKVDKQ